MSINLELYYSMTNIIKILLFKGFLTILIFPILTIIFLIFIFHFFLEGGPFLFKQERSGFNNKIIKLVKIRTMNKNKISKFGIFLRKTKLDELPQFFLLLFGKISLVGPRPLLKEYTNYYKKSELIRFSVNPGLTGLSQIKANDNTIWDKRLRWDIIYVKKKSFKLDIYIILITIKIIFLNLLNKRNDLGNFIRLDEVRKTNGK